MLCAWQHRSPSGLVVLHLELELKVHKTRLDPHDDDLPSSSDLILISIFSTQLSALPWIFPVPRSCASAPPLIVFQKPIHKPNVPWLTTLIAALKNNS